MLTESGALEEEPPAAPLALELKLGHAGWGPCEGELDQAVGAGRGDAFVVERRRDRMQSSHCDFRLRGGGQKESGTR
jgi:hypothetical protein